jgi:hypothetical protein
VSSFVLAGYFGKRTAVPPGWSASNCVDEICSVSQCVAPGPEGWLQHWLHNDWGFYNSPADALSVLPEDRTAYSLFAYRILLTRYHLGQAEAFALPSAAVEPLSGAVPSLGFDAVSRSVSAFFECSPLSCNGLAADSPVNRYCLLDTLPEAVELAQRISVEHAAEPGPYYVVEVSRLPWAASEFSS